MNPPVIVRDATAGKLVIVLVQVWRQDHRLGLLRLWLSASHATMVAGVSSVPPCVPYRPSHEQPPGKVEERQAASLRPLPEPAHRDVKILLNPIRASGVKQCRPLNAQTASVVADSENTKQFF